MWARSWIARWGVVGVLMLVACDESPSYPPGHVYSVAEAVEVCKRQIGGVFDAPTYEVAVPEEIRALNIQIFHTPGHGWRPGFLLHEGQAFWIGGGDYGGHIGHVTSVALADLEQDGSPEVVVAYDQSSGKWNQKIWSYEPASSETAGSDARLKMWHPDYIRLETREDALDVFHVEEIDYDTWTLDPEALGERVGRLGIERADGSVGLVLID